MNFMNFKTDIFLKFVKIREFYELLKFIEFEFSIYDYSYDNDCHHQYIRDNYINVKYTSDN